MRNMKTAIVCVSIAVCLFLPLSSVNGADPASPQSKGSGASTPAVQMLKVGDTLPDLDTKDMEGKPVAFKSVLKPDVLNVIAFANSTCYSCNAEAGLLASLKGKHKEKIHLVGVVVDMNTSGYKLIPEAVRSNFVYLHDSDFKMTPIFGFSSTPSTALIKGDKIVALETGFVPSEPKVLIDLIEKNL